MRMLLQVLAGLLWIALPAQAGTSITHRSPAGPASHSGWSMPQQADTIRLSWIDGPPQLDAHMPVDAHLTGFREEAARLAFRSGRWGLLLDPVNLKLERFTLDRVADLSAELLDRPSVGQWPSAGLELSATINGNSYRVEGARIDRAAQSRDQSPVHFVESGDWFQHIVVHDLNLIDAGKVVLDRIFRRDDLGVRAVEFVERGVERGRLAGASRPGHQNDAIGSSNQILELPKILL